jgi:hypothetical protein
VNCIVFSRDRAMQLDALLQSLDQRTPDLFTSVTVIYRPTNERFEQAYAELESERPELRWLREGKFRHDILRAIGPAERTVFHTDDDVYFRTPGAIDLIDDEVCFTLRLGQNTIYCYPLDIEERLLDASVEDDRVSWDWALQGPGAYSYPLALNGHVLRTEEIYEWLTRASYSNPNELEAALQAFNAEVNPRMASFRHSVVVSIPANVVNETYPNRHGAYASVDELNERFLAGGRIDVGAMDFSAVRACHQEIPFVFREA